MQQTEADMINHPSHYKRGGFEVMDIILAFGLCFLLGNVIKYVLRFGHKGNRANHIDDLKKARVYLTKKIDILEAEELADPTFVPGIVPEFAGTVRTTFIPSTVRRTTENK